MEVNPQSVIAHLSELMKSVFSGFDAELPTEGEKVIAEELMEKFKSILLDYELDDEPELIQANPTFSEESWSQGSYFDDDGNAVQEDDSGCHVSIQRKEQILKMIAEHPKWSVESVQRNGGKEYLSRNYKKIWTQQVLEGGTRYDKLNFIDTYVITRFHEARKELKCVRDLNLRKWAIQATQSFRDSSFTFKASPYWAAKFKLKHGITSRKVTKLVSRRQVKSMDIILENARRFQSTIKTLSNNYRHELILNTDQVGFAYEITGNRTLSYRGEKLTAAVAKSPKNLVTHSYTVMYTISMDGGIVGDLFMCLQEPTGRLGPQVQENLFVAPNVTLTCTTSGKVTRSIYEYYLDQIIIPNVKEDFLFLVDSYAGQTNALSYADRFGIDGKPVCNLQIIPEKCTDISQPLDTTFHRQLKHFAKSILAEFSLNYSSNVNPIDEITTRNNNIRMQSLLHNQLKAEPFRNMIKYCWFSSGLSDSKPLFSTVSEVCFHIKPGDKHVCQGAENCTSARFIKCAHCKKILCFSCFFL